MINRCIGVVWLLVFSLASPAWAQTPSPVARVAISVGDAVKVGPTGQTTLLQAGSPLAPGDRVRTGPDALAILVFSDEGRLSVRGDSELWIRHYEVDPSGVRTRIEIDLVRGTVRQISGNGSRAQPERYKLNTPIAVIGVRGTDFLAKATSDAVEAFVHEGRIVLLPLGDVCAAAASSRCDPVATVTSASNSRYVRLSAAGQVEQRDFRPGELEKIFGVDVARLPRAGAAQARVATPVPEFQLPSGTQFITETIFAASAADRFDLSAWAPGSAAGGMLVGSAAGQAGAGSPTAPVPGSTSASSDTSLAAGSNPVGGTAPSVGNDQANGSPPSPTSTATAAVSGAPTSSDAPLYLPPAPAVTELPRQLVWGRFTNAAAVTSALLQAYPQAAEGRHVTVGELGQYALWRADPTGRLNPGLKGNASFMLASAEAWFVQPNSVSGAEVNSASLSVDFDRSTFAAAVSMSHAVGGKADLAVNGVVNNEGVFVGVKGAERVAGALTRDGKEAGYLFSKDVTNGTFRGITLWGRK